MGQKFRSFRITEQGSTYGNNLRKHNRKNAFTTSYALPLTCTSVLNAKLDKRLGSMWYKSKNNFNVSRFKNAGRQFVGICTVDISSIDSSVDVPIKSKLKQFLVSRRIWFINLAKNLQNELVRHWHVKQSNKTKTYPCCDSSIKFKLLLLSLAVLSRLHDRQKMSYNWVSLNEHAIFRCFVNENDISTSDIWFISQVSCDRICTPIIQCSTEPWNLRNELGANSV